MSLFYSPENLLQIGTPEHHTSVNKLVEPGSDPAYIYDLDDMVFRLHHLRKSFSIGADIHYAMKANSNDVILRTFKKEGAQIDTVSAGEIRHALACGFEPADVIFSGVGKTGEELGYAIDLNIKQINVESPQELERIARIAATKNKKVRVAFRLNPDVDAKTHPYITTGLQENKFGMDSSFIPELKEIIRKNREQLHVQGVTLHIGSQLEDISPIEDAIRKTIPVYEDFARDGNPMQTFDIGGGVGTCYKKRNIAGEMETITRYGKMASELLAPLGCRLLCEPGRILVGPGGVLVSEVQYIKSTPYKNFMIVNTGMHHLMRPSLYQAWHDILPVHKSDRPAVKYDIVGPICESADVLGFDREIPEVRQGDLIAVANAGAYGYSMANLYNEHRLPRQILLYRGEVIHS